MTHDEYIELRQAVRVLFKLKIISRDEFFRIAGELSELQFNS